MDVQVHACCSIGTVLPPRHLYSVLGLLTDKLSRGTSAHPLQNRRRGPYYPTISSDVHLVRSLVLMTL